MSKTLTEIAQQLKETDKRVQLIYAFNGTGKTRLSREFKQLISPKNNDANDDANQPEIARNKILYYNAFTEDLFYWDNDLALDAEPKLKIQPNSWAASGNKNTATRKQPYPPSFIKTPAWSMETAVGAEA